MFLFFNLKARAVFHLVKKQPINKQTVTGMRWTNHSHCPILSRGQGSNEDMIFILCHIGYFRGDYANALLHYEKGITKLPEVRSIIKTAYFF